jgi:hypothetical protein
MRLLLTLRWPQRFAATAVLRVAAMTALLCAVVLPRAAAADAPWRASARNTEHWAQMDPRQRLQYQQHMRRFTRLDECIAFETQHRQGFGQRLQPQRGGAEVRAASGCEQLHASGALQ